MSGSAVPGEENLLCSPQQEGGSPRCAGVLVDPESISSALEGENVQDCTLLWELPREARRLHAVNKA